MNVKPLLNHHSCINLARACVLNHHSCINLTFRRCTPPTLSVPTLHLKEIIGTKTDPLQKKTSRAASLERFSSSESLVLEAEEWETSESSILAPVSALYSTSDRLSISGDVPTIDPDEGATQSIIVRSFRPSIEEDEESASESTMEVRIVESGPGPLEQTYLLLKQGFADEVDLRVKDFQISTRSGRSLASTIESHRRREMIAAFTGQAIQFADPDDEGMVAQLAAGDLQLLVLELPHKRLLTCLFDAQPDVDSVRVAVSEYLQSVS